MLISLANRFFHCLFPLKDYSVWPKLDVVGANKSLFSSSNRRAKKEIMKKRTKSPSLKNLSVGKLGRRTAVLKGLRKGIDPFPTLRIQTLGSKNTSELIVMNTNKIGRRFNKELLVSASDEMNKGAYRALLKSEIEERKSQSKVASSSSKVNPVLVGDEKNSQLDMSDTVGKRPIATTGR